MGNLGSFECFVRYLSGDGTSTFAGPIVLIASLVDFSSRTTVGLYLDMYLQMQRVGEKDNLMSKPFIMNQIKHNEGKILYFTYTPK